MPLKGFSPASPNAKGATVSVRVQNPPESPWPPLHRKQNPVERIPPGLWFLGGVLALLWIVSKLRPTANLGSLNAKQSGVGQISKFKIEPGNAERVRSVIHSFLERAQNDKWFGQAVYSLLIQNHVDTSDQLAVATFLHHVVNDVIPTKPDPDGFESIVSPEELMTRWARLGTAGMIGLPTDCDDKTLFLAAMAYHAGIDADVVLLDTDGDGQYDHAGVIMRLGGREVFAETVLPGVQLGWEPQYRSREVIHVPR